MIMRTILVSSHKKAHEVEQEADYYLRPPLHQFKLDDYAKIEEITDIGYRYAEKQIEEWRETHSGIFA